MPKSSKHKKARAADFQKAKLKLGKGKAPASNATDTSFKARTIALPQKSIYGDRSAAPTTRRNLTLDELLIQLRHYSAGTRKDALFGLRELLSGHTYLLEQSLGKVINSCVRLIGDDEQSVRKALHSFFSWLLPQVPSSSLAPHQSALLLFTTSALSHIFPEVRLDAVRILDLFLAHIPNAVVGGWEGTGEKAGTAEVSGAEGHGERVMQCYLNLLGIGTGGASNSGAAGTSTFGAASTASTDLSASAKVLLLQSLRSFVVLASGEASPDGLAAEDAQNQHQTPGSYRKSAQQPACPTWFFEPSFNSPQDFEYFERFLQGPNANARVFAGPEDASNLSEDWHSAHFVPGALVDVDQTAGRTWSAADLHTVLGRAENALRLRAEDGAGEGSRSSSAATTGPYLSLSTSLHPFLLSTFLDSAPNVFSPSSGTTPGDIHTDLISALAFLLLELWRAAARRGEIGGANGGGKAGRDLATMLGHMAPYFPFGPSEGRTRGIKDEQQMQALNLAYCELVSLLSLSTRGSSSSAFSTSLASTHDSTSSGAKGKGREKGAISEAAHAMQLKRVGEYVVQTLRGELSTPTSPLGQPLSSSTYISLLPTIWLLLSTSPASSSRPVPSSTGKSRAESEQLQTEVLSATIEHFSKMGAGNATKRASFEFIARLCVLHTHPSYTGSLRIKPASPLRGSLRTWFAGLPRFLWESGSANASLTDTVLEFFRRIAADSDGLIFSASDLTALQAPLAPFFHINHPTRGAIPGPYARLPAHVQDRAKAFLHYLEPSEPRLENALSAAEVRS